jgi:hypothetical protein
MLHIYMVDDGEQHWIAAATPEDAFAFARDDYGVGEDWDDEEARAEITVTQLPDEELLTIGFPDDPPDASDVPPGGTVDGIRVTATASAWAHHAQAGLMVGSSVY